MWLRWHNRINDSFVQKRAKNWNYGHFLITTTITIRRNTTKKVICIGEKKRKSEEAEIDFAFPKEGLYKKFLLTNLIFLLSFYEDDDDDESVSLCFSEQCWWIEATQLQGSSLRLEDKFFFQYTQKQKVGDVSVEWPSSEIDWPQKGLLCCCRVLEKPSSETSKWRDFARKTTPTRGDLIGGEVSKPKRIGTSKKEAPVGGNVLTGRQCLVHVHTRIQKKRKVYALAALNRWRCEVDEENRNRWRKKLDAVLLRHCAAVLVRQSCWNTSKTDLMNFLQPENT